MVAAPMIVTKRSWLAYLTAVRGTSLQRTWPRLAITFVLAVVVTVLHQHYGYLHSTLTTLPFSLVGVALGIFLGFRNNTSYDRFWEGRKLWGRLVNTSRSLTRQISTLVGTPKNQELRRELVLRVIAFVHVLRYHLRDETKMPDAQGLLPDSEFEALSSESNRPNAVSHRLGQALRDAMDQGLIDRFHLPILEGSLTELTDIQGGCERIKSTPIPTSYTVLIHRIVATYAVGLPFGIVDTVGMWTPVVVLIITYAFYGLDAIGFEIEDPFGFDRNDLPLRALSRMIEVNLRQRLGDKDLPELCQPSESGVLD